MSAALGRDSIREALREAITRGDMAPGHRLVEADLVEAHGVSRASVRLAIDALIADGLVERVPHRGARVRTLSLEEAVEIIECRMVLEGLIARKAAERVTDDAVARLGVHERAMRAAVADGELFEYSRLISELHAILREAAQQATASGLVARLQAQIVRHQFQLSLVPGRPRRSLAELEALIRAVATRDGDRAEAAARDHLAQVVLALREDGARRAGTPAGGREQSA